MCECELPMCECELPMCLLWAHGSLSPFCGSLSPFCGSLSTLCGCFSDEHKALGMAGAHASEFTCWFVSHVAALSTWLYSWQLGILLSMIQCLKGWVLYISSIGPKFGYDILDTHWNIFCEGCLFIQVVQVAGMRPVRWPTKLDWHECPELVLFVNCISVHAITNHLFVNCISVHAITNDLFVN